MKNRKIITAILFTLVLGTMYQTNVKLFSLVKSEMISWKSKVAPSTTPTYRTARFANAPLVHSPIIIKAY